MDLGASPVRAVRHVLLPQRPRHPTPALNALATIMLLSSLLAVGLGFLVYRRLTRGERGGASAVREFAAQLE